MANCDSCGVISTATGSKGDNGGFNGQWNEIIANTSTVALVAADTGSQVYLDRSTGSAITLPTGVEIGTFYDFTTRTDLASGSYSITLTGSDVFEGFILAKKAATADEIFTASAAFTDHIFTMNGTTQGGDKGTQFRIMYIATNRWFVSGQVYGSGVLISNFT